MKTGDAFIVTRSSLRQDDGSRWKHALDAQGQTDAQDTNAE
jgi:hypothetical protein